MRLSDVQLAEIHKWARVHGDEDIMYLVEELTERRARDMRDLRRASPLRKRRVYMGSHPRRNPRVKLYEKKIGLRNILAPAFGAGIGLLMYALTHTPRGQHE